MCSVFYRVFSNLESHSVSEQDIMGIEQNTMDWNVLPAPYCSALCVSWVVNYQYPCTQGQNRSVICSFSTCKINCHTLRSRGFRSYRTDKGIFINSLKLYHTIIKIGLSFDWYKELLCFPQKTNGAIQEAFCIHTTAIVMVFPPSQMTTATLHSHP